MKPNWTALEALVRTLLILAAATFVGALTLPLSAEGTLPVTWAAWKPVLAVAGSASAMAEILWLRKHLKDAAAAIGLSTTTYVNSSSTTVTTPSAGDTQPVAVPAVPPRGYALLPLLVGLAVLAIAFLVVRSGPAPTFVLGCLGVIYFARARLRAPIVGTALALGVAGCLVPPSPAQQVTDGENLETCVASHWGESLEAIAGACVNSEIPAATDLVADIEAIVEVIAGTTAAASPYAGDARVMSAVPAKAQVLRAKRAPKPTSQEERVVHLALVGRGWRPVAR